MLPGWHHDFIFALPCSVWLMPQWDSVHWGQLVELGGGPRSPLWGPAASASQCPPPTITPPAVTKGCAVPATEAGPWGWL